MSGKLELGTCDRRHDKTARYRHTEPHFKKPDCANWREGESAPAQPGQKSCFCRGKCTHSTEAVPPAAETAMTAEQLRSEFEKILSPAVNCNAPYAKAMVTMLIKTAEAYAHVREAAQERAMQKGLMKDNEVELPPTFGQTGTAGDVEGMLTVVGLRRALEAAQRQLAELGRGDNPYLAAAYAMANSDIDRWKSRAEAAERKLAEQDDQIAALKELVERYLGELASLRAESKEPVD